jgi:hypothetical protein
MKLLASLASSFLFQHTISETETHFNDLVLCCSLFLKKINEENKQMQETVLIRKENTAEN